MQKEKVRMSRWSHRIIRHQRPYRTWSVVAKNYVNPEEPRYFWGREFQTEAEARVEAERVIKYSQAVYLYPPSFNLERDQFYVLNKKGTWKQVIPTKR